MSAFPLGMFFLDLTLPDLAANLALDEALLLEAEQGGAEVLRLWEWPTPAVVLGAACRVADNVHVEVCRQAHIPLHRRASGGGTVLLDRGCLVFSLVLAYRRHPALEHVPASYRFILGQILEGLHPLTPALEQAGTSDLSLKGCKISGNSQQRKRAHVLHHGTLLYAFDIRQVGQYLKPPPRQPEYRRQRTHGDFLNNLPLSRHDLCRRLCAIWGAETPLPNWPRDRVAQLVREKYGGEEWVWRR